MSFQQAFIEFALKENVLKFGEFKTKAGRLSPYFFNAGLFNHGASLLTLSKFYAQAIYESKLEFNMLFGPAYKGISLAAGTAMMLKQEYQLDIPFAFNRKEIKDHGEGGILIGAPLKGKVLMIDDVISAGTSVRQSIDLIRENGAEPAGVAIALDRMERGLGELSATQEVTKQFNIPVISIANLKDILAFLEKNPDFIQYNEAVLAYRKQYGVDY